MQDFSRQVADLSLQQQEEKVISLLKATSLQAVEATVDARKTCGMDKGYEGTAVLYVIRFDVTDLSKLPNELLQKIRKSGISEGCRRCLHGRRCRWFHALPHCCAALLRHEWRAARRGTSQVFCDGEDVRAR